MNILVTGCMGFIGSNLVPMLLKQGHNVLGFDDLSRPSINPTDRMKQESGNSWNNFKFYRVNICNFNEMSTIMVNEKIDAIIHLAAVGSVPLSFNFPEKTYQNNVIGFVNVFNIAKYFGIKKFIFASSSSVYGTSQVNPRKEGTEGKPLSPYALSKKMNEEHAILCAQPDMSFVGLRFFNVYGPGQSLNGYYSAVLPRFCTEQNPEVYGDGNAVRDFTFVEDVGDAIIRSLYVNTSGIFNIGTGNGTSINELLEIVNKKEQAIYKEERPGDVVLSIADIERSKAVLNFEAKTHIKSGAYRTIKFYEDFMGEVGKENA